MSALQGTAKRLGGRSGPIGRQVEERGKSLESLSPVGDAVLQALVPEPRPLPDREVGILDRQGQEGCGRIRRFCVVERSQLPEEDAHRPRVGNRVMQCQEDRITILADPDQAGPEERPRLQVEGKVDEAIGAGAAESLGIRRRGEIDPLQREPRLASDALDGTVTDAGERRSQDLVTLHDRAEGSFQPLGVQGSIDPGARRDHVGRAGSFQAIEEPEPLLGPGERDLIRAAGPRDRIGRARSAGGLRPEARDERVSVPIERRAQFVRDGLARGSKPQAISLQPEPSAARRQVGEKKIQLVVTRAHVRSRSRSRPWT